MGNDVFKLKRYEVAEKFYTESLQLNLDSRPVWTNRAVCRNTMKKHEDALADCLSALSIDPKNTKKGIWIEEITIPSAHSGFWIRTSDRLWATSLFENPAKTITQKGNAHLGLGQFEEANECYELLRELGETSSAENCLKKLAEAQE